MPEKSDLSLLPGIKMVEVKITLVTRLVQLLRPPPILYIRPDLDIMPSTLPNVDQRPNFNMAVTRNGNIN